jgi:hypothetical protein
MVRKASWSMQSEIVTSCSHVRLGGILEFAEDDDEDGSIDDGGNPWSIIARLLGVKSIDESASAEEMVGEETARAILCWWSWLEVKGS